MSTLDSVIRYLSLTTLDADDPRVTRFAQRPPVAGVTGPEPGNEGRTLQGASAQQSVLQSVQQRHPQDRCWCSFYTLERTSPNSVELVPGWSHTLAVTTLTDAEERREESRRLVWSSISLTANWTAYNAATLTPQINLPIIDPANVRPPSPSGRAHPCSHKHAVCDSVPRRVDVGRWWPRREGFCLGVIHALAHAMAHMCAHAQ